MKAQPSSKHWKLEMLAEGLNNAHFTFARGASMKNPMDRQMEKRLSDRVVAIGREGDIEAFDELLVQSGGEKKIVEWLTGKGIAYRYDSKYRIIAEFQIRPDFYLPELDLYIEYWGLDTPQYKMSMYKKQTRYQQQGKKLISVYPKDLPTLDQLLTSKLRLFGFNL